MKEGDRVRLNGTALARLSKGVGRARDGLAIGVLGVYDCERLRWPVTWQIGKEEMIPEIYLEAAN